MPSTILSPICPIAQTYAEDATRKFPCSARRHHKGMAALVRRTELAGAAKEVVDGSASGCTGHQQPITTT